MCAKLLQLCLTLQFYGLQPSRRLCYGILQARILEWVAISSSRGSSQPRDRTHVSYISCIGRGWGWGFRGGGSLPLVPPRKPRKKHYAHSIYFILPTGFPSGWKIIKEVKYDHILALVTLADTLADDPRLILPSFLDTETFISFLESPAVQCGPAVEFSPRERAEVMSVTSSTCLRGNYFLHFALFAGLFAER